MAGLPWIGNNPTKAARRRLTKSSDGKAIRKLGWTRAGSHGYRSHSFQPAARHPPGILGRRRHKVGEGEPSNGMLATL